MLSQHTANQLESAGGPLALLVRMAHLPQDELPSEFDVVIDGTGKT